MTFLLEKSEASDTYLSRFRVKNAAGDVVGHINVKPSEEADLLAHWRSSAQAPARAAAGKRENPMVAAMVKASKRHPLNKQAVLRGC
jgi:hypothetical protein